MSWIYVIVGIAFLLALQSLRGTLSMDFPRVSARPVRRPDPVLYGGLDVIEEKTAKFAALGFDGPVWVGDDAPSGQIGESLHAVFRSNDDHTVAWLGRPTDPDRPNALLTYYTTLLADGRYAVTQVRDPYFSCVDDPQTPAQTIQPSSEPVEIEAHREFVKSLGIAPARLGPHNDILRFASDHMNAIRSRLIERGRLREVDGVARPSFRFAFDIMRILRKRPKLVIEDDATEVPTPRLAYWAKNLERIRERAPSQGTQWLLLLISAVLSLAIGWPLFGLELTAALVAVIAFHEAGHWAAMRAFGYQNPHITFLPLLGGVTIGHEADPSAGKRAWVALAGPLPGILLGWALVFLVGFNDSFDDSIVEAGWVTTTIWVLLVVNYLNILPIPPFDGSHVVQAILPPRWFFAQALLLLVGFALGVAVAYVLDFWPLALIAGLQLLGLRSLWQSTRLAREFDRAPPPSELDESGRLVWMLEALEKRLGPPKAAMKRLGRATDLLHTLDTQPMGGLQRTLVSSVFFGLVFLPVGVLAMMVLGSFATMEVRPEFEAMYDDFDEQYEALTVEATTLDIPTMIDDIMEGRGTLEPASDAAIAAAEERLGARMPDDLRTFYAMTDGLDELGLGGVDGLRRADLETIENEDGVYNAYDGEFHFWSGDMDSETAPIAAAANWWYLGAAMEVYTSQIYIDPGAAPGKPRIFDLSDGSVHSSFRGLIEQAWVDWQSDDIYDELNARMTASLRADLEHLSVSELVDELPKPSLIERWVYGSAGMPEPASDAAIRAAEARIGRPLPDDHREVLGLHNGLPIMTLLPVEEIRSVREAAPQNLEVPGEEENLRYSLTRDELDACWVIAGNGFTLPDEPEQFYAMSLWCPHLGDDRQYLDPNSAAFSASFADVLLDHVVRNTGY
ncbi:MAG: site-2 protease family protein [Woeseiaceae bacterium]|nr:site-2 protease family protein [Woeseiaceae bacterium]